MNSNKFINSDYLKNNPLCGIDTYKDELDLATGECVRKIKKRELRGNENWIISSAWKGSNTSVFYYNVDDIYSGGGDYIRIMCSDKFAPASRNELYNDDTNMISRTGSNAITIRISDSLATTTEAYKQYLAAQYAAGTPVTVWYVLATPTTETITVPSGLSGTEEGFLNQSGTPTPTNPIYPTANTVEKWFGINHYVMETSTDTIATLPAVIYANDTTATVGLKGNTSQASGTTTVPSKSVTVSSLESGTNYALFPKADFPNAVVGDTINVVVGGTSYSQKVMKIDTSYVYIENRTV